ncbi:MAG: hypothetical protein SNJ29_11615 [Rikenellaceae bacterium]
MDLKKIDNIMGDTADAIVPAILEQVPGVNFFVSVVNKVKSASLQRRFESWQEMVNTRLSTLESEVFDALGDNDTFATALLKTTELAAQSNQKKMELLANFVRYTAENEISDDYLILFINNISKYTLTHIITLKYFQAPIKTPKSTNLLSSSALAVFKEYYPNIDKTIIDIVVQDLQTDGLMVKSELNGMMSKESCFISRTSDMGDKFIESFGIDKIEITI